MPAGEEEEEDRRSDENHDADDEDGEQAHARPLSRLPFALSRK
jgi:hypothetical protein